MAFSAYNPASILRRNTTERIGQMLKTGGLKPMLTITRSQDAVGSNLDSGYTDYPRNFGPGTTVPNAGAYGATAVLPTQSSPPDPVFTDAGPIEPQALPQPPDYWTRIDPSMGYVNPTLTINPGNNGAGGGNGLEPTGSSLMPVAWQQNAASNHGSVASNSGSGGGISGGAGGPSFASILPGGYGNMGFAQGGGGYITQLLLRQAGY